MTRLAELEPLLLPAPRRLERSEGRIAASDPTVQHSTEHGPEGYRLVVGCEQQGVRIETKTPAGEQRARATLSQLERQYGAHIPRLVIDDWPTIERRGVSLDVSRDRVPTRARLDRLVDAAAGWKLNEVELYTEHTFAYAAHEAVWKDASPITPDELREFDRRACALGVRWIANQNCFGHFERWLKHPAYADLAETHGAFEFEGIQLQGPFSLNPTDPRALELVRALLDELLPCVTGGAVHLGCDETQDIGQGASAAAVKESGAFAVWSEYVGALATHVNDAGHEPRIWADIALRWPERLAEQHPALVPIAWGYEPDHPFRAQASSLAASGRPFHLACGTSTWRGFTGRTTERRGALSACVDAAREHGARGVMCTEWGDVGHRQVPVLGEFAWAEFAARAWNPEATPDPRAVSLHALDDPDLELAEWLADWGDLDRDLRAVSGIPHEGKPTRLRNANALFEELHPSGFPYCLPDAIGPWHDALERLEDLERKRPRASHAITRQLQHAANQCRLALHVALARRSPDPSPHSRVITDLAPYVVSEQRRLWCEDSRLGGLEDSLDHWRKAVPELGR